MPADPYSDATLRGVSPLNSWGIPEDNARSEMPVWKAPSSMARKASSISTGMFCSSVSSGDGGR